MNRRSAVIVDMDGTLCDVSSVVHLQAEADNFAAFHRGCAQCPPNQMVVDWCVDYHRRGHTILIVTGRDGWARALTEQWLLEHLPVPIGGLYMRGYEDYRANVEVKREAYEHLRRRFEVRAAIEDDPVIVELWEQFGITVTDVAEIDMRTWEN